MIDFTDDLDFTKGNGLRRMSIGPENNPVEIMQQMDHRLRELAPTSVQKAASEFSASLPEA